MEYVILDKPFRSKKYKKISFWKGNFIGYTTDLRMAGKYTLKEILEKYNYPELTDLKDFYKKENENQCFYLNTENIEKMFGKAELTIEF